MAPVSKPVATWMRRTPRFEEGPSGEGSSSGEDSRPLRSQPRHFRETSESRKNSRANFTQGEKKKRPSSFALSESSANGRSYVDPWDMENYSFLRRQLEEVSLSDNDVSSGPAFESTQSDFYYVPLDGDGSPQYQYKQYVDANGYRDEVRHSPMVFQDDTCGRVASVDEHHFYNDYIDPQRQQLYELSEPSVMNPSRQSERSRCNSQDYHLYTPPSIMQEFPGDRHHSRYPTMERKYRTNTKLRANKSYSDLNLTRDTYSDDRPHMWSETMDSRRKSFSDVKMNRRQSFKEGLYPDEPFIRMNDQHGDRRFRGRTDRISRRKSIHEIATPPPPPPPSTVTSKPSRRLSRRSILASHSVENLSKTPAEAERGSYWGPSAQPDSLVYVYETGRRRSKMVLPNTDIYNGSYRGPESDSDETIPTIQSEIYSMRPLGRYAMTNYGHLKIDYSCSWNNLHRYITDKIRG